MGSKFSANGSWKTSTAGLAAVIAIVADTLTKLTDSNPGTNPDWNLVIPSLASGLGLLFARDNDKSSEQVKAGPKPAADVGGE